MAIPDRRIFFAGQLNAIPSPNNLYHWVKNYTPNNANFSEDYQKTVRSPARGIPVLMQPLGNDSHFISENQGPSSNLYPTRAGDIWVLTFYACSNKDKIRVGGAEVNPTIQASIFGANEAGIIYNGSAPNFYDVAFNQWAVTTDWQKYTITLAVSHPDVKFIQSRFDGPDIYDPYADDIPAEIGDVTDKLLLWFDDFRLVRTTVPTYVNTREYDIDDFVAEFKGAYSSDVFKQKAQEIIPIWSSNSMYITSFGVRYGFRRKPETVGLSYWTASALANGWSISDLDFLNAIFTAASGADLTRSLTDNKAYDPGPYSGTFHDKAPIALGIATQPEQSPTVVSIYKTIADNIDGDSPLRNPWAYIDSVYFDTRFNYLNIPQGLTGEITLNFPYVQNYKSRRRKKKKKKTIDIPHQERRKSIIYEHNFGKIPLAVCYEVRDDGQAGYFFGGTTIIQNSGRGSYRVAWIEADAKYLWLTEWAHTIEQPLSAMTMKLRAYVFDKISNAFPTGSVELPAKPQALMVVGSEDGKLWQLREQSSGPKYYLSTITQIPSTITDEDTGQSAPAFPTYTHLNYTQQATYATANYWDWETKASEWFMAYSDENRGLLWLDVEYPGDGEPTDKVGLTRTCLIPDGSKTYLGLSYTQAGPAANIGGTTVHSPINPTKYSIYKSNTDAIWTKIIDLPNFTTQKYCSGGGGITCSTTGVAVVVAAMEGGQGVYGVKLNENWIPYDLENFNPKTTTVTFSGPQITGGVTALGEPVVDIGSRLVGIKITEQGSGYLTSPTLTITDSDSTPVPGTVNVTVTNTRTVPAVYDGDGNLVSPEQKYWKVTAASSSGSSNLHKKTSKITFSGSTAKGTLTISNGVCTSITITDQGAELGPSSSAPSVTATISDTDNGSETTGTYSVILTQRKNRKSVIMHSSNWGVSWSNVTVPVAAENDGLTDVICNNSGLFVAVGYNNTILTSSNGTSWTVQKFIPTGYIYDPLINWQRVIYAKGNFWIVGHTNSCSYIIKSTDGATWTQVSNNADFENVILEDMTYLVAKSAFFVVGRRAQSYLQYGPVVTGPSWVYENETANIVISNLKPNSTFTWTGVTWNGITPGSGSTTTTADGIVYFKNIAGITGLPADTISSNPPWNEAGAAVKLTWDYSCNGNTFQHHYWVLKKTAEDPDNTDELNKNKDLASGNPPPKLEIADYARYTSLYTGTIEIPNEDMPIVTSPADYTSAFYFSEDDGATWVASSIGSDTRLFSVAPSLDYNPASPP